MKPHLGRFFAFVLLSSPLLVAPACNTMKNVVLGPVEAVVTVTSATPGQLEQYIVTASANSHAEAGVRALQKEDWALAATGFRQALIDDAEDDSSHFGLGIALEMSGDLPLALAHFETANRLTSEAPVDMYVVSIARVKAQQGR
jgi:Tfp pilus assembly protein PilF